MFYNLKYRLDFIKGIAESKASIEKALSSFNSVIVPSDYPKANEFYGIKTKIENLISKIDSAQSVVTEGINKIIASENNNNKEADFLLNDVSILLGLSFSENKLMSKELKNFYINSFISEYKNNKKFSISETNLIEFKKILNMYIEKNEENNKKTTEKVDISLERTQASDYTQIGIDAYNDVEEAQQIIIDTLGEAARRAYNMSDNTKYCPSILVAQAINESGWLSFTVSPKNTDPENAIKPDMNNVLGMNSSLANDEWTNTTWNGDSRACSVPQEDKYGNWVYGLEEMREFPDIETCLANMAELRCTRNTYDGSITVKGNLNYKEVVPYTLSTYATDHQYIDKVMRIIEKYNLDRFDDPSFLAGEK